jgi:hypothetical protein
MSAAAGIRGSTSIRFFKVVMNDRAGINRFLTIAVCVFIAVTSVSGVIFSFEDALGDPVDNLGTEVSAVDYPYLYTYTLAWQDLQDPPVDDFHYEWPTHYGAYIEVIPPENWIISDYGLYGPNYQANPNYEFTNVSGSLGGFKIYGKLPYLQQGEASLTQGGNPVATTIVNLPALPEPATICLFALGAAAVIRRKNV